MKKLLIVELILSFVLTILIIVLVYFFRTAEAISQILPKDTNSFEYKINMANLKKFLTYGWLSIFASIGVLILAVVELFSSLNMQNSIIKHLNTRKKERAAARAAKAERAKQKRIAELQTELEELKKDDNPPSD